MITLQTTAFELTFPTREIRLINEFFAAFEELITVLAKRL